MNEKGVPVISEWLFRVETWLCKHHWFPCRACDLECEWRYH